MANFIYIVTRQIKYPDIFVESSDEEAIKIAEGCGPRQLYLIGATYLPIGYLCSTSNLPYPEKLKLVKSWEKQ